MAKVPEKKFEAEIAAGHVTRAAILKSVEVKSPEKFAKEVKTVIESETECDKLKVEVVRLKAEIETLMEQAGERDKAIRYYSEALEADDRTKPLLVEIKRLNGMNVISEGRIASLMAEKNEAVKAAKYWQKKAGK